MWHAKVHEWQVVLQNGDDGWPNEGGWTSRWAFTPAEARTLAQELLAAAEKLEPTAAQLMASNRGPAMTPAEREAQASAALDGDTQVHNPPSPIATTDKQRQASKVEALEWRFPLSARIVGNSNPWVVARHERTRTLRQALEEMELILAGDDATYRPSVALAAVAAVAAQWRALLEAQDG